MSGLDLFLQSELNVLGTEAKKKFQNIKDAADKVIALLRVLKAQAVEHNVDVAVGMAHYISWRCSNVGALLGPSLQKSLKRTRSCCRSCFRSRPSSLAS